MKCTGSYIDHFKESEIDEEFIEYVIANGKALHGLFSKMPEKYKTTEIAETVLEKTKRLSNIPMHLLSEKVLCDYIRGMGIYEISSIYRTVPMYESNLEYLATNGVSTKSQMDDLSDTVKYLEKAVNFVDRAYYLKLCIINPYVTRMMPQELLTEEFIKELIMNSPR